MEQFFKLLNNVTVLSENDKKGFLNLVQIHDFKKNEYFGRVGESLPKIGFVISGLMRVFFLDAEGNEFTKTFCQEDSIVGACFSIFQNQMSNVNILALEDTKMAVVEYYQFEKLCRQSAAWQLAHVHFLKEHLIKQNQREHELLTMDALALYSEFKTHHPQLMSRISQAQIASYLGLSPVTLSRLKRNEK